MKLDAALDEYELLERRRHRGEDRGQAALASLREFLRDYSGFEETGEVGSPDLFQFLLEYYPSQETPDPEVALALLGAAGGFARWLLERGERGPAAFAAAEDRLREDLPRAIEASTLLREHARRDDLGSPLAVSEEGGEADVGTLGSGLDRLARLDQVDYGAAQEEYFTVQEAGEGGVILQSAEREALGEGPVRVLGPAAATALLRPGDILHAELAPGPEGWELLEVFGVRPGGY